MTLTNEQVKVQIKALEGTSFSSYASLFQQLANHFIRDPSFQVEVEVIFTLANLLNDLYRRATDEDWDLEIRDILRNDALRTAGLLVRILNRHPAVTREQYDSYDTYVKELGEILRNIHRFYMN